MNKMCHLSLHLVAGTDFPWCRRLVDVAAHPDRPRNPTWRTLGTGRVEAVILRRLLVGIGIIVG